VRIALLIVFGSLGTLARYALQGIVQERTDSTFPSGTLVVNLLGCFLLGGIAEYALAHLTIPQNGASASPWDSSAPSPLSPLSAGRPRACFRTANGASRRPTFSRACSAASSQFSLE
jgi:hypothetical protein